MKCSALFECSEAMLGCSLQAQTWCAVDMEASGCAYTNLVLSIPLAFGEGHGKAQYSLVSVLSQKLPELY